VREPPRGVDHESYRRGSGTFDRVDHAAEPFHARRTRSFVKDASQMRIIFRHVREVRILEMPSLYLMAALAFREDACDVVPQGRRLMPDFQLPSSAR